MIYGVLWAFGFISGYFIVSDGLPSCIKYPPCRYNILRHPNDMSGITVNDNSNHFISWSWGVRGGRWNVTYKYTYPNGWYEGTARFSNRSSGNPAVVKWGYLKNWESNRVRIFGANAWNISYNGDIIGFIPTGYGRYIFKIFTKNKRHDPFGGDDNFNNGNNNNGNNNGNNNNGNDNYNDNDNNYNEPNAGCSLTSTDKNEMARWWSNKKSQRNCYECIINWPWNTNRGRWRVVYKWVQDSDLTTCSVKYRSFTSGEEMQVINWELDPRGKTVTYKANPIRINGENGWQINLSPNENWGFTPEGNGKWIFQHYSRNLVFRPFNNFRGTMNIS